jgi:hypothetical protein
LARPLPWFFFERRMNPLTFVATGVATAAAPLFWRRLLTSRAAQKWMPAFYAVTAAVLAHLGYAVIMMKNGFVSRTPSALAWSYYHWFGGQALVVYSFLIAGLIAPWALYGILIRTWRARGIPPSRFLQLGAYPAAWIVPLLICLGISQTEMIDTTRQLNILALIVTGYYAFHWTSFMREAGLRRGEIVKGMAIMLAFIMIWTRVLMLLAAHGLNAVGL